MLPWSLAQFILKSGYGKSEPGQNANNCFGMKKSLYENTWSDSTWDARSNYIKRTGEQNPDGPYVPVAITADFRKYSCVEDSIRNVLNSKEAYAICLKEDGKAIGAIELKLNGHTDMTAGTFLLGGDMVWKNAPPKYTPFWEKCTP